MKTASAKAKGRKLQNILVKLLRDKFPSLEEDDVLPAIMGESGVDIKLSPAARQLFPYSVECKNVEKLSIWAAIKQAEANCKPGTTPAVAILKNRLPEPYIAIPLSKFIELVGP